MTYRSRKSPASWRGSYAEQLIDLSAVNEAQIFFEGSAREAARLFPANANVAATIALGGIGLDATRVQLMVDPATQRNTHTLHAEGLFGEFHRAERPAARQQSENIDPRGTERGTRLP